MDIPAAQKETESPRSRPSTRRIAVTLLLVGLLILLAWVGWKAWRIERIGQSLLARQEEAEAITANGIANVDADAAESLVLGFRADVVALRDEVSPFLPLAPAFTWLPKAGPVLENAAPLLEMADAGTEAAAYGVRGLKPALVLLHNDEAGGEALIAEMLPILEAARPDLIQAARAMDRVAAARAALTNEEALPWRVRTLLDQVDSKLPLAQEWLALAPVLPQMLGADGPRRYLIIAQNQDELRATGGFISGAGLLVVDSGRIQSLDFIDANLVDDWRNKPYPNPPAPLYEYMGLELFMFRDANFWPDFPTSAEQVMFLYSYGQDAPPLDGAIALDQQFVAMLVGVTGPIAIPELEITVSANNVIEQLRDAWGIEGGETVNEWIPSRKDFLGPFAASVKDRLLADFGSIDLLYLADTLHRAAAQKHLQIYTRDPAVAATLAEIGWDGRLHAPAGSDLLMVVDSNVGYNKVNPRIDSDLTYAVTLDEDGRGVADLTVHYQHTGRDNDRGCVQEMPYSEGPEYTRLLDGCYWNYVRVYAPAGSTLADASSHEVPNDGVLTGRSGPGRAETVEDPSGLAVFANYLLLPRAQALDSIYRYQLPPVVQADGAAKQYRLVVAKQAGIGAQQLQVTVTLPAGATFVSATPAPAGIDGQTVTFSANFATDLTFTINYR